MIMETTNDVSKAIKQLAKLAVSLNFTAKTRREIFRHAHLIDLDHIRMEIASTIKEMKLTKDICPETFNDGMTPQKSYEDVDGNS